MRYAFAFFLAAVGLTVGAVVTFAHISTASLASTAIPSAPPVADTVPSAEVTTPIVPTSADYARYAAADRAWRQRHARQFSISELRARGDGNRTAREAMQDRVYLLTKRGDRDGAIAELERWIREHRRDDASLLALARLLNEAGRTNQSIARYRQVLALRGHRN